MTIKKANKFFNALEQYPPEIRDVLICEERAFMTMTRFFRDDCIKHTGAEFDSSIEQYDEFDCIGTIVVDKSGCFKQANLLAKQRPFNEKILGVITELSYSEEDNDKFKFNLN